MSFASENGPNETISILITFLLIGTVIYFMSTGGRSSRQPVAGEHIDVSNVNQRDIDTVAAMFPNVCRVSIATDLASSRSVAATADNILNGRVPLLPTPQAAASQTLSNSSSTSEMKAAIMNYIPSVKIDNAPKVWCQDSASRQQVLLKRKQFMMQQARLKFEEKERKNRAKNNPEKDSVSVSQSEPHDSPR